MSETTEARFLEMREKVRHALRYHYDWDLDSPTAVALYNEIQTRRTGRTEALIDGMVNSLCNGTPVVGLLVHDIPFGREIVKKIQERLPYGSKLTRRIIIFCSKDPEWLTRMRARRRGLSDPQFPIFVDNAVTDNLVYNYITQCVNGSWQNDEF